MIQEWNRMRSAGGPFDAGCPSCDQILDVRRETISETPGICPDCQRDIPEFLAGTD